jgi:hypothetical protein
MGDLELVMQFIAFSLSQVFTALDSIYVDDYSILDIFLAMFYFEITFMFAMRMIRRNSPDVGDVAGYASSGAGYAGRKSGFNSWYKGRRASSAAKDMHKRVEKVKRRQK